MSRSNQKGFSLLELLVAMTILAVMGTVGIREYRKYSAQARQLKAQDDLRAVGNGLDQYYLRYGYYPEFSAFEAMIEPNSALVKGSFIAVNSPAKDPWGQPYSGVSSKTTYKLESQGDPGSPESAKIEVEPGKHQQSQQGAAPTNAGAPK